MTKFGETERYIKDLFSGAEEFVFGGVKYTVLNCGKPTTSKGECKTDVYVLAQDKDGKYKEFKISVKQHDADFLENKISLERAIEILGNEAQEIIKSCVDQIKVEFENDYLVYFNKHASTEAFCLKMGWKFELLNKIGGNKSGIMKLSDQQKIDIYAGTNLNSSKKNCTVNGENIENSGIANYILNVDILTDKLDYYLKKMQPIEDFAKAQKIYFACKALNYRCVKDKWDENRPLAVYVHWKLDKYNKLIGELVYDKPLSVRGNEIGENIRRILSELNINKENFINLKDQLHENVRTI